jgi:hypothetical protein
MAVPSDSAKCYREVCNDQEAARASNPAGRVQEARNGDLPRSEGSGREGTSCATEDQDGEAEESLDERRRRLRDVVSVPKSEIDRREAEFRDRKGVPAKKKRGA